MNNIFLHFTSNQSFSLSINGNYIDLVDNIEKFCIDIIPNTNNLYVTYNPIGNDCTYLNYTQNIQIIDNKPVCKSDYVKIIPFCENHFEINFEPISANNIKSFEIVYNKNHNNINITINNTDLSEIKIFEGEKLKHKTTCKSIKQAESFIKENNLIIKCYIEKNNYFVLIIDLSNFEVKFEKYCNKIEESENDLKILIVANDLTKHALVFTYNYKNKLTENFTIYLNNQPITTHIKTLIPLQFLECIKVGNLNFANSLLVEDIKNENVNSLKEFFGDIDNIYFNGYSKEIINYTIENKGTYKNYTFEIDNNKIIDIIEN